MESTIIRNALDFVREVFQNDYSGHDYFHTLRVYKTATRIAEAEGADVATVSLAALLHDVDDRKLSPETCVNKDKARAFLRENGASEASIETICKIIAEVSFSEGIVPDTLESQCVQDADRLDALGAVGIARTFAYGGSHHREMYNPDIPPIINMSKEEYANSKSTSINHFYEKLFLLKGLLNTSSAKQIAEYRENFMHNFVNEFLSEWNGDR